MSKLVFNMKIGTRLSWQLQQENLQSAAADFNGTAYLRIDLVGDLKIFPKYMQWTMEFELLVTTDFMGLRRLFLDNRNTSATVLIGAFWMESSQRLYIWAVIWWSGMAVIYLFENIPVNFGLSKIVGESFLILHVFEWQV